MEFKSKHLIATEANLNNPSKVLLLVGEIMRSRIQNAFAEQSRGSHNWSGRGVPNIMGIIEDLEKSPNVKERRFDARPALLDTGNLIKSFGKGAPNMALTGKYIIEVGTPVPYAPKLNVGGTSEKDISKTVKKNLTIYLRKIRRKAKKSDNNIIKERMIDRSKSLGWLFSRDKVEVHIIARPFAIITSQDMKDIVKLIKKEFTR